MQQEPSDDLGERLLETNQGDEIMSISSTNSHGIISHFKQGKIFLRSLQRYLLMYFIFLTFGVIIYVILSGTLDSNSWDYLCAADGTFRFFDACAIEIMGYAPILIVGFTLPFYIPNEEKIYPFVRSKYYIILYVFLLVVLLISHVVRLVEIDNDLDNTPRITYISYYFKILFQVVLVFICLSPGTAYIVNFMNPIWVLSLIVTFLRVINRFYDIAHYQPYFNNRTIANEATLWVAFAANFFLIILSLFTTRDSKSTKPTVVISQYKFAKKALKECSLNFTIALWTAVVSALTIVASLDGVGDFADEQTYVGGIDSQKGILLTLALTLAILRIIQAITYCLANFFWRCVYSDLLYYYTKRTNTQNDQQLDELSSLQAYCYYRIIYALVITVTGLAYLFVESPDLTFKLILFLCPGILFCIYGSQKVRNWSKDFSDLRTSRIVEAEVIRTAGKWKSAKENIIGVVEYILFYMAITWCLWYGGMQVLWKDQAVDNIILTSFIKFIVLTETVVTDGVWELTKSIADLSHITGPAIHYKRLRENLKNKSL